MNFKYFKYMRIFFLDRIVTALEGANEIAC